MAFLPVLFRIQAIEIKMRNLEQCETEVKQDANFIALKTLRQELEIALTDLENEMNKNISFQRQLDLELKSCLEHFVLEENKLYSGKSSNPRELEQHRQKMVEYQKSKEKLEERLLELMETGERCAEQRLQIKKRLERCLWEITDLKKTLNGKLMEISMQKTDLIAELEDLSGKIPPEWLERYRKIARSHRGIGIAKMQQNSCGGCHVSLSELLLQKVKHGVDQLFFCENCGRILYY